MIFRHALKLLRVIMALSLTETRVVINSSFNSAACEEKEFLIV